MPVVTGAQARRLSRENYRRIIAKNHSTQIFTHAMKILAKPDVENSDQAIILAIVAFYKFQWDASVKGEHLEELYYHISSLENLVTVVTDLEVGNAGGSDNAGAA